MSLSLLPQINATLNAISACLLIIGYCFIRKGAVVAHRFSMLAAFATSVLFLTSYLIYHFNVGSVAFRGIGWIRPVYFSILISHTVLAVTIVPLILRTLYLALKERWESHRQLARWTLPLWLYVSVTGVVIYFMVYEMY